MRCLVDRRLWPRLYLMLTSALDLPGGVCSAGLWVSINDWGTPVKVLLLPHCGVNTIWIAVGGTSSRASYIDVGCSGRRRRPWRLTRPCSSCPWSCAAQSQLFHGFHLLDVRGSYPPKRVVYIEHNTNPEGGVQRPHTTGWRPSRSPLGVHVCCRKRRLPRWRPLPGAATPGLYPLPPW